MKFLCDVCREHLTVNSEQAIEFWKKAWHQGSIQSDALQWEGAITAYGNALEAAEILLDKKLNQQQDLERYIRTAQELTYAFRKSGYFDDMDALALSVEARLAEEKLVRPVKWYLRPLVDVANNPICAVDMWMKTLKKRFYSSQAQAVH